MLARRQEDTKTRRPWLSGITVVCFAAWFAASALASSKHAEYAKAGLASPSHAQRAQAGASRFALALVNDPKGKAIVDIGQDDFVVQEGNVTREVLDVRVADYPVVLVLDNGSAASADFAAIKAAALRFVERIGQRPLAIVTTAGAPNLIAAFEDEHDTLAEKIEAIDPPRAVDGQPLRALALAARTISATGALFSTIVLATASPIEVGGTAAEEFVAPIVDSRAVVHVVANDRGGRRNRPDPARPRSANARRLHPNLRRAVVHACARAVSR
jgi:hypothetical protein